MDPTSVRFHPSRIRERVRNCIWVQTWQKKERRKTSGTDAREDPTKKEARSIDQG